MIALMIAEGEIIKIFIRKVSNLPKAGENLCVNDTESLRIQLYFYKREQ